MSNEPSLSSKPFFNEEIADKILIELDGWQLIEPDPDSEELELFLDTTNEEKLKNLAANKKVSLIEVKYFYDKAFNEALTYTNRLNIDNLDDIAHELFMDAVFKLAASNIWKKYNIQVNNDTMEGAYVESHGGLLYKKSCNILDKFIKSNLIGLHSLTQ